jgi:hypothetical protein
MICVSKVCLPLLFHSHHISNQSMKQILPNWPVAVNQNHLNHKIKWPDIDNLLQLIQNSTIEALLPIYFLQNYQILDQITRRKQREIS